MKNIKDILVESLLQNNESINEAKQSLEELLDEIFDEMLKFPEEGGLVLADGEADFEDCMYVNYKGSEVIEEWGGYDFGAAFDKFVKKTKKYSMYGYQGEAQWIHPQNKDIAKAFKKYHKKMENNAELKAIHKELYAGNINCTMLGKYCVCGWFDNSGPGESYLFIRLA